MRFRIGLHWPSHLSLRLLALLLAICLWFLAAADQQVSWFDTEERVISLPVATEGAAADIVVTSVLSPVQVRLRTPKGADLGNMKATADVTGMKAGEHRVLVSVTPPPRSTILEVVPPYAQIRLERSVNVRFTVEVAIVGLPSGQALEVQPPKPAFVTLSGAESRVAHVSRAVAEIVYRPANEEVAVEVRPVDAAGRDVPWIKVSPAKVNVAFTAASSAVPPAAPEEQPGADNTDETP